MKLLLTLTATLRRLVDLALVALVLVVLATLLVARGIPALTHSPTFVVSGGSMEPTVPLGAVVITEPVAASDLAAGNIVSVQVGPQHSVFTHRIVRVWTQAGQTWIQTKGDANNAEDPSVVPATDVLGRVSVTIPLLGYAVQMLSIAQGVVFLVSTALLMLLAAWLLESLEGEQSAWLRRREATRAADSSDPLPGAQAAS